MWKVFQKKRKCLFTQLQGRGKWPVPSEAAHVQQTHMHAKRAKHKQAHACTHRFMNTYRVCSMPTAMHADMHGTQCNATHMHGHGHTYMQC